MTKDDSIRNSNADSNVGDGTDSDTIGSSGKLTEEKMKAIREATEKLHETIRELERQAPNYGTGK